jgi:hypothetical protein
MGCFGLGMFPLSLVNGGKMSKWCGEWWEMIREWKEWQGKMTRVDEEQCGCENDCGGCQGFWSIKGQKCISLVWQGVLGDDKAIGKLNVKGCMELLFGVKRGAKEQQRFQKEHQGTS